MSDGPEKQYETENSPQVIRPEILDSTKALIIQELAKEEMDQILNGNTPADFNDPNFQTAIPNSFQEIVEAEEKDIFNLTADINKETPTEINQWFNRQYHELVIGAENLERANDQQLNEYEKALHKLNIDFSKLLPAYYAILTVLMLNLIFHQVPKPQKKPLEITIVNNKVKTTTNDVSHKKTNPLHRSKSSSRARFGYKSYDFEKSIIQASTSQLSTKIKSRIIKAPRHHQLAYTVLQTQNAEEQNELTTKIIQLLKKKGLSEYSINEKGERILKLESISANANGITIIKSGHSILNNSLKNLDLTHPVIKKLQSYRRNFKGYYIFIPQVYSPKAGKVGGYIQQNKKDKKILISSYPQKALGDKRLLSTEFHELTHYYHHRIDHQLLKSKLEHETEAFSNEIPLTKYLISQTTKNRVLQHELKQSLESTRSIVANGRYLLKIPGTGNIYPHSGPIMADILIKYMSESAIQHLTTIKKSELPKNSIKNSELLSAAKYALEYFKVPIDSRYKILTEKLQTAFQANAKLKIIAYKNLLQTAYPGLTKSDLNAIAQDSPSSTSVTKEKKDTLDKLPTHKNPIYSYNQLSAVEKQKIEGIINAKPNAFIRITNFEKITSKEFRFQSTSQEKRAILTVVDQILKIAQKYDIKDYYSVADKARTLKEIKRSKFSRHKIPRKMILGWINEFKQKFESKVITPPYSTTLRTTANEVIVIPDYEIIEKVSKQSLAEDLKTLEQIAINYPNWIQSRSTSPSIWSMLNEPGIKDERTTIKGQLEAKKNQPIPHMHRHRYQNELSEIDNQILYVIEHKIDIVLLKMNDFKSRAQLILRLINPELTPELKSYPNILSGLIHKLTTYISEYKATQKISGSLNLIRIIRNNLLASHNLDTPIRFFGDHSNKEIILQNQSIGHLMAYESALRNIVDNARINNDKIKLIAVALKVDLDNALHFKLSEFNSNKKMYKLYIKQGRKINKPNLRIYKDSQHLNSTIFTSDDWDYINSECLDKNIRLDALPIPLHMPSALKKDKK